MSHVVDYYPTLVMVAGGSLAKSKTLDGVDLMPAVAEGKPSQRTEIVHNIEMFRGAVRQDEWKLVWRTNDHRTSQKYTSC